MEYFFNKYPEFIEADVRTARHVSPIDAETLSNRHEVALPQKDIEGKTVLDLGSCLGATGQWCLAHNAKFYLGVEAQYNAVTKSNELLSKHWEREQFYISPRDIVDFLDELIEDEIKYDVVVAFGIVYGYVDYYGLLSKMSKVAKERIVIDCRYPSLSDVNEAVVQITANQHCHIDGEETLNFTGAGTKLSPVAMRTVMQTLGWDNNGNLIFPDVVEADTFDMYLTPLEDSNGLNLPTRYLTVFEKTDKVLTSVSENVANNDQDCLVEDKRVAPIAKKWEFDSSVAEKFLKEAEGHIPDYHKVIEISYNSVITRFPNKDTTRIIDVGSAIGHTVDYFIDKGYAETYGVEKSSQMIDHSVHQEHILHADVLPQNEKWDAIIANWTLHFIDERKEYLTNIFKSLNPGGILVLTDKTEHSPNAVESYYNFKRNNGISDEEINAKRKSLKGVLTTLPLAWYLTTLKDLGFEDVQIINARFMFVTIHATKPL